jgi:hypothetical protein
MIRASSFPILLAIALYERQTYRQDPLMEQFEKWTDRWLGGLPRLVRNVGKSTRLLEMVPLCAQCP